MRKAWALSALLLAACAPEFNPPPDYKGGYLMNTDRSRTAVVESGDTLSIISRRYDVPTKIIADRNGLRPPYTLTVGQSLILDPTRIHTVREGDTLATVAARYDVDERVLASANDLRATATLRAGQELWIPDPITNVASPSTRPVATELPPVTAAPRSPIVKQDLPPAAVPLPPPVAQQPVPPAQQAAPPPAPSEPEVAAVAPRNPIPEPAARASARFAWPVKGKIVAKFGPAGPGLHNDGINIAAAIGTQVKAADNGVVAYAGNELKGFGNLLLIKHADGWTTAYAHNDKLLVKRGDKVTLGQPIATVGRSGNVDGAQLHFEVRKGTQAMDPMEYLVE